MSRVHPSGAVLPLLLQERRPLVTAVFKAATNCSALGQWLLPQFCLTTLKRFSIGSWLRFRVESCLMFIAFNSPDSNLVVLIVAIHRFCDGGLITFSPLRNFHRDNLGKTDSQYERWRLPSFKGCFNAFLLPELVVSPFKLSKSLTTSKMNSEVARPSTPRVSAI